MYLKGLHFRAIFHHMSKEQPGDDSAVGGHNRVLKPPFDFFDSRQRAATRAGSFGHDSEITASVTDKRHGEIIQSSDHDLPKLAGRRGPAVSNNLHENILAVDV